MSWAGDQVKKGLNVRTYVLTALLIGVLVWIQSLDAKQQALRARVRGAAPAPAVPAPARVADRAFRAAELASVPAGWGRDPFERRASDGGDRGPVSRSAARADGTPAPPGLYLQGIMSGPLGRSALINGTPYREGERIGSREVIQIGRRSVLLMDHGTVTTLHFKGDGS